MLLFSSMVAHFLQKSNKSMAPIAPLANRIDWFVSLLSETFNSISDYVTAPQQSSSISTEVIRGLYASYLLFLQQLHVSSKSLLELLLNLSSRSSPASIHSSKESLNESPNSLSDSGKIWSYLPPILFNVLGFTFVVLGGIRGLKNLGEWCVYLAALLCGSDSYAIDRNESMNSEFCNISWFLFRSF